VLAKAPARGTLSDRGVIVRHSRSVSCGHVLDVGRERPDLFSLPFASETHGCFFFFDYVAGRYASWSSGSKG